MSLWIQQGYGKGDKIDRLAAAGAISGVILSPADEEQANLRATADTARSLGLDVVLDPQTYVGSITGGTARCHPSHGLDFGRVHWGLNPTEIGDHVSAVWSATQAMGISTLLSPTCIQRGFTDAWTTLAIQYARTSIDVADEVYVSVVVEEAALGDWRQIEDWLDVVTTLDARGFYLIVSKTSRDYPQPWNTTRLSNLLRIVHRLAVLNGYQVLVGYSDFEGLLAQVAGAKAFGSGWFFTLRAFTELKWQPSTGGAPGRARATSGPMLTPFRAEDEANRVAQSSVAALAYPDAALRDQLTRSPGSVSIADAWSQHLLELGSMATDLEAAGSLTNQRQELRRRLETAVSLFEDLRSQNVPLPAQYQTRVSAYLAALAEFESLESPA